MDFQESIAKVHSNLDSFMEQFKSCMQESEEDKQTFKKFKGDVKAKVDENYSSRKIQNEKRRINANLNEAIMLAEDAAHRHEKVYAHCEETGCLVNMENARDGVVEGYDELINIALFDEGKISFFDDDEFVDGVNFDGQSFSL